jgi:hypothetical protein
MELTGYEDKIIKVAITDVLPNTWNPKEKNHAKVADIERSITKNGFKQPVQVREHPTQKGKYEIIDGEQRWTAMSNLGATHIYIYNNGVVSDEDAKSETIWWQVQVPFETISLAHLVTELSMLEMELPYNAKELAEFKEMAEFDYDKYDQERPGDEEDLEFKTFTVKLGADAYQVLMDALETIKEENDCSDARAIELMAADFIAGR